MAVELSEKLGRFFNLGFAAPSDSPPVPLMLGKKRPSAWQRLLWEVASWLLVTCGIFLRKALMLPELTWTTQHLTLGAFLASAAIALATFPPFMKWFNRRRPRVSVEHFATAFAFGFFLDLAAVAAYKIVPRWHA